MFYQRFLSVISLPFALVLLMAHSHVAQSSQPERSLKPGETIEATVTGAEAHSYKVSLEADKLFQVRAEQHSVDVSLKLIDTAGNTVASMDSPNGKEGPETLTFVADKSTKFTLEVAGFDPKAEKGAYTLRREKNRSATETDRRRVAVEKVFAEAMEASSDAERSDMAIAKMQQALDGWQSLGDQYLARLTSDEVRTLKQGRAKALFRKALDLVREGSAASLRSALSLLTDSARLYEEAGDVSKDTGLVLLAHGSVSQKLGEMVAGLSAYDKALEIFRRNHNADWEATTLSNMGMIYIGRGDSGRALEYLNQALELRRAAKDKDGEAMAINNIAGVYNTLGDNRAALEQFTLALTIFREVANRSGEGTTLNNIGRVYTTLGDKRRAMENFEKALQIHREIGNRDGEAFVLINIGQVNAELGERQKALDLFSQALTLFRQVGDKTGESGALNNIGAVYVALRAWQKAIENFKEALPLVQYLGDKRMEATIRNNIGMLYSQARDRQNALKFFELALQLVQQVGDKNSTAIALNNIGMEHFELGEKEKALEYYEQSLPLFKQVGDVLGESGAQNNIGRTLSALGKNRQAIEHYNEALLLSRRVGDKQGEAVTLSNMLVIMGELHDPQVAIFYGKQSINKFQELRSNIHGLDKDIQKSYLTSFEPVYRKLADLLVQQGQFAQAERVLAMLKEEEYFDFVRRDTGEISKLQERVPLNDRERALVEQYTQLADKVTELGQEFTRLDEKKRRLTQSELTLLADEQKRYDELETQLASANAAFQLFLRKQLAAEIGDKKVESIEVDRALQAKLRRWGEGTVALFTIVGPERYRVVLTTPAVQVDGKTETKIADLNKKIFDFRAALQNPRVDPRPLGKELYDILVKPVESQLAAAKAKTLVWSLDGTLRYIPLAALSPDGKHYLAETMQNVIITPTTRDDLSRSAASWEGLGLGISEGQSVADPDDKSRSIPFNPLPGTELELSAIVHDERVKGESGVLPGRRLMNKDFSLAAFKDQLAKEGSDGKRKFNLIHIASHFRLGSNWTNSFLLLGNGETLSLEDINDSPSIDFDNVDLVTLSACNTGFADDANGKEIDSLASVIQTKSGKAVLATLWPVADESTSMLMSEFYRIRQENPGITKAGAMQRAQVEMISGKLKASGGTSSGCRSDAVNMGDGGPQAFRCDPNAPFSHPYFWSPFVLIGNWR